MTPSGGSRQPRPALPGGALLRRIALILGVVLVGASGVMTGVAQASTAEVAAAAPAQTVAAAATANTSPGYWEVGSNGEIYGFGVPNYGDLRNQPLNRPIVGMAADGGGGYWLVASDGGVFSYGAAKFYGSTGGQALNKPIVGMAATSDGGGYWLVASDGGVFAYGDAGFYGSTGSLKLNKPIVGMATTPDGKGYWLVASDGGIFAFGDAAFYGSTGSLALNKPVVGMSAMPGGGGYNLVASDGGIFSFGDAPFEGSTGSLKLNKPIVSAAPTGDGAGYWLSASDGGIFSFGDAKFEGSAASSSIPAPIVAIAATSEGNPYPAGATGYDVSWPQCASPTSFSAGPLPPTGSVSIVGVNDGHGYNYNPCFEQEAAWAGPNLTVYINVDEYSDASGTPTPVTAANAYQTGVADAANDVSTVEAEGYHPLIWWLDVEGPCGSSDPLWQCEASGQALNDQVIQGALATLDSDGLTAGIYSTYIQWPDIVGTAQQEPGVPIWIATVPSSTTQWAQDCSSLAFAEGTPYLVQWAGGQKGVGFDQDLACGV
jgi:hypothetical protein